MAGLYTGSLIWGQTDATASHFLEQLMLRKSKRI